jgi:hypothetical protein
MKTLATLFLLASSLVVHAQDVPAMCRQLLEKHDAAIVNVSAVVKVTVTGSSGTRGAPREIKLEAPATVIDATAGLIVTALSRIDPSNMPTSSTSKFEASLQDVRLVLADGSDVPANIVLKDTDLDIAFIRADLASKEAKGIKLQAIDITDATDVGPGDDLIGLSRAEKSVGRVAGVHRGNVYTVAKRPRKLVLTFESYLGNPVFAANGKFVGIGAARSIPGSSRGAPAIITATDVQELAAQARNAKVPEPKKEEKKEEAPKPAPTKKEPAKGSAAD